MNYARSTLASFLVLLAACADNPASLESAIPDPVVEVWEPAEDDLSPPTIPTAPTATVAAEPAAFPPEVFVDATASAPPPAPVATLAAPVDSVRKPEVTQVPAPPSYVVASLPEPTLSEPLVAPSPTRLLPQAAPPRALALPPQAAGPKPMAFLAKLEQGNGIPPGDFGFILLDAQSGQILNEQNADTPMPPASIAKLLASIAILEAKGMNGSFRTSLLADGSIAGGVLTGDLHLVGGGDPTLNRSDLSGLARRLSAAGINQVNGRFFYHGDALPEVSAIDPGQPAGAIYNPGISGLNLDRNERRGTSPVTNPSRYTAEAMKRAAQSAGVTLPTPTKGRGNANGNEVAAHDSAPVSAILTEMFDISRNMTAEVLGAAAAAELSRKPSSLREAAAINTQWAQSRIGSIGGAEWAGFNFVNNSGLTTRSRATPRQMAALFLHGYQQYGEQFRLIHEQQLLGNSAGVDFEIRVKFGTLSYARGLGGIMTLGGRDMVFVIMATDPARSTRNAKAWMDDARRLEQAVISDWMQNFWPPTRTASR